MKKEYLRRQSYSTDLTDTKWKEVEFLFVSMREYKYSKRELLNAVLYLVDNGCKWRNLPHDFPPSTQLLSSCNPEPTYGIIDSLYASEKVGKDVEKKKGHKRHIVTDTLGCMFDNQSTSSKSARLKSRFICSC